MSQKFAGIPVDDDTVVLLNTPMEFDGLECMFQIWVWDGIQAQSLIFVNEDVAHMDDQDLKDAVRRWVRVEEESDITLSRSDSGFTFVNFNFTTEDD
jgi:hypothetical protein